MAWWPFVLSVHFLNSKSHQRKKVKHLRTIRTSRQAKTPLLDSISFGCFSLLSLLLLPRREKEVQRTRETRERNNKTNSSALVIIVLRRCRSSRGTRGTPVLVFGAFVVCFYCLKLRQLVSVITIYSSVSFLGGSSSGSGCIEETAPAVFGFFPPANSNYNPDNDARDHQNTQSTARIGVNQRKYQHFGAYWISWWLFIHLWGLYNPKQNDDNKNVNRAVIGGGLFGWRLSE